MRSAHTVVLERNTPLQGEFATEPYEVGWATQAVMFIDTLDALESDWSAHVEISPDGIRWCEIDSKSFSVNRYGLTSIRIRHFGSWLRVRLVPTAPSDTARVLITLSLK